MRTALTYCALAVAAAGCAAGPGRPGTPGPRERIVWEGEMRITGTFTVPAGADLRIMPGTRVLFERDGAAAPPPGIVVYGSLTAAGEPRRPVVFAPAAGRGTPGGWGPILLEEARDSLFRHCRFEGAAWALHAHFTPLLVESCRFAGGEGGIRFRGGPVKLYGNVFRENGTAIRYWESAPEIISNAVEGNGTGIFCRQGSPGGTVRGNNFRGNRDYHVKLGELQADDLDARYNYWGSADPERIEAKLYDRLDVPYLGRVRYLPLEPRPFPLDEGAGRE